jgi:hypothetical protein
MAVMPTGGSEPTTKKKTVKKSAVEQKIEKSIENKIDKALLQYPTNNKVLRFFGDTMLLIGSIFTNVGLRYGGVYEYEFEETKA